MVTYRGLNCTVPKSPRITVMMWTKFVRIGAHWYPRKSNICRSKMLIWKREIEGKYTALLSKNKDNILTYKHLLA